MLVVLAIMIVGFAGGLDGEVADTNGTGGVAGEVKDGAVGVAGTVGSGAGVAGGVAGVTGVGAGVVTGGVVTAGVVGVVGVGSEGAQPAIKASVIMILSVNRKEAILFLINYFSLLNYSWQ